MELINSVISMIPPNFALFIPAVALITITYLLSQMMGVMDQQTFSRTILLLHLFLLVFIVEILLNRNQSLPMKFLFWWISHWKT